MQTMTKLRTIRRLAWLLVISMVIPCLSTGALAAQRGETVPQSVVIFPIDSGKGVTNPEVAAELSAFLTDGLSAYRGFRVVAYSDRLPAVQRLVSLQPEKRSAATGPFSTDSAAVNNAVMLGKVMLADLVVVGSVDKYVFSESSGTVEVTASMQVLDGRTGKSVERIVVTGSGTKPAGAEGVNEASIRRDAVRDAGRKIIKEITGQEYQEIQRPQAPVTSVKKSSKRSWIPMLLLSLGVGLLLGGSGGGDGTTDSVQTGTDAPERPPDIPPGF